MREEEKRVAAEAEASEPAEEATKAEEPVREGEETAGD